MERARFVRDAEANGSYDDVLAVQRQVLGGNHPHTLTTQHNIGRVLHQRGDLSGAKAQYLGVTSARLRVLGPEHPDTVLVQAHLAEVTRALDLPSE